MTHKPLDSLTFDLW